MKPLRFALACLFALGATACNDTQTSEPVEETGTTTSAAVVTRLYATEGDNELSFETLGTFETRNGERVLVLHATSNRYLESVFSFVPDDIFGETNIISERRLEVVLREGHELNTVLSGLPLFISVNTFTGSPDRYFARIVVAPRFFDFRGSTSIWIDEEVDPVYVVQGTSNLLYRGHASVPGYTDWLTVTAPDGIPHVDGRPYFRLDWTYPKLYQAIDPHTVPLTFSAGSDNGVAFQKTARLVARVTELSLTAGDPYEVWPSQECLLDVYNCIHAKPTGTKDFSSCGTYRQVSRCMYATACDVTPPQPLLLTGIDASSLEPARAAYNADSSPLAWNTLNTLEAYSTPQCPASPVTIQAVMAKLNAENQSLPQAEYGTFTDRAGLAQTHYFSGTDGAALLSAMDAYAGGGAIQAWVAGEEVPCHNCHDFNDYAVLFYPGSRKVIVLQGNHGYDS